MLRAAIRVLSPQNAVGSGGVAAIGVWEPKTESWIQQSSHSPPEGRWGRLLAGNPRLRFK